VTTLGYARSNTLNGKLGRGEPKEEQRHKVAFGVGLFDELCVGARGESGFEGEILILAQQILHPLEHNSTSLDGHTFLIERRKTLGNLVGVDELAAIEHLGQHSIGSGGFSRSITTGYDVEFSHINCKYSKIFYKSRAQAK
jgi:hypothetical protein